MMSLTTVSSITVSTATHPASESCEIVVRDIIPELKRLGAEGIIEYPLNKIVP